MDDLRHAPSVFDDSFLFSLNYFYTLAPCFIGESILNDHDRANNSLKAGVKWMFRVRVLRDRISISCGCFYRDELLV